MEGFGLHRTESGLAIPFKSVLLATARDETPKLTHEITVRQAPNLAVIGLAKRDPRVHQLPSPVPITLSYAGRLRGVDVWSVTYFPLFWDPSSKQVALASEVTASIEYAKKDRAPAGQEYEDVLGSALRRDLISGSRTKPSRAIVSSSQVGEAHNAGGTTLDPVRIETSAKGIHRIGYQDLLDAGLDLSATDPGALRIVHKDMELPIWIDGEGDGSFDPGDAIEFFASDLAEDDREFNTANVYWLKESANPGPRMASRSVPPSGGPVASSYTDIKRVEEDRIFWQLMPAGEEHDHYVWERVTSPDTNTYSTVLDHVDPDPTKSAKVTLTVFGRSSTPVNPDHHLIVSLNGSVIDDFTFDGDSFQQREIVLTADGFQEGNNDLTIESPDDTGASVDSWYMNWFEFEYRDRLIAESDRLCFAGDGGTQVEFNVDGFTTGDLRVFDVTDPLSPTRLTGWTTEPGAQGTLLRFEDQGVVARRYCAFASDARLAPQSLLPDVVTDWSDSLNQADMLIVYHEDFAGAAADLATFRRDRGLTVAEVEIQDVFDEFHGGLKHPQALKDFIAHAYHNWMTPPPAYVLFLGDADQDSRDIYGTGDDDFIPTRLHYTTDYGTIPQDHWFSCVDGDDLLPDLAIGRLAARTSAEADTLVQRIMTGETAVPPGDWNQRVLLVADDEAQFEQQQDALAALLPPSHQAPRVYLSEFGSTSAAENAIRAEINTGAVVVNYVGHGDPRRWATESMWHMDEVPTLSNGDRTPLVVSLSCINGFYSHPTIPHTLAEAFMAYDGKGAVAAWAPTGLGYPLDHEIVGAELFTELFQLGNRDLGMALTNAKVRSFATYGISPDLYQTLTLLGDPAGQLPLDRDGDELLDVEEEGLGLDPLDGDADDDGLLDGLEPWPQGDTDGDGVMDTGDPDADEDGIPDGVESGIVEPGPDTDVSRGNFFADGDPSTVTDPGAWDTDAGGAPDGAEDRDSDGVLDAAETDPAAGQASDDPACLGAPIPELDGPGVYGLHVAREGDDLRISWTDAASERPCVLYRVYVAVDASSKDSFGDYVLLATTGNGDYLHKGAATDGSSSLEYLIVGFHPVNGEGELGHYGR